MSYGDTIHFRTIKNSRLFYEKPSEKDFNQSYITAQFIDTNGWCNTLEFNGREDWFKFVRKVNYMNKIIKKKNIEKLDKEKNE